MLPVIAVALLLAGHVRGSHSWGDRYFGNSTGRVSNYSTISTSLSTSSTTLSPESPPFDTTPSAPEPSCSGSVTYIGSVYPTIYVTVTEGYEVTITASDASYTASETLITPLPACQSTIVPNNSTSTGIETSQDRTTGSFLPIPTSSAQGNQTSSLAPVGGRPHPLPVPEVGTLSDGFPPLSTVPFGETLTFGPSPAYSSAPYTSTVTVTKKTPVLNDGPSSFGPVPIFTRPPSQYSDQAPTTTTPNSQPSNPGDSTPSHQPNNPGDGEPSHQPNSPGDGTPGHQPNNPGDNSLSRSSISDEAADGNRPATSPAGPSTVTAGPSATPSSPTIRVNNVPVSVGASSVIVGTQAIAIPTTGAATVRVGSQLFTIEQSLLLASGTTVALAPLQQVPESSAAPPAKITAAPGVIITVQGTTAIIAGTTYRIGSGAAQTTISVSGQRIQLGPSGVVLATTTIPANYGTQESGLVVESYDGLTFSVGATAAIIAGTTYAIGSGAPITHTTIHGQSVSFGPGGVGVEGKTTFKPTTVVTTTGSVTATSNVHSSASGSTGSGSRTRTGSGAAATTGSVQSNAGAVALGLVGESAIFIDIIFSHWSYLLLAALGLLG
ncbi:hypothetical protein DV736_g5509, partial [Chaetothyriales sp. CBS 134916]